MLYKVVKVNKIHFIDEGVLGDVYRQNGTKYYDIECDLESIEKKNYCKKKDVLFRLQEEELNKLLNGPFDYDPACKTLCFEKADK